MATKSKAKHEPEKPEGHKAEARPEPPRQRTQPVGQPQGQPAQAQPGPAPMPRPVFARREAQKVPVDAQRVINSLQQTVRSQAVLIRNYQELLRLEGREVEGEDGDGQDGQDQAA